MKLIKLASPNCRPCEMVDNYLKDKEVEYETVLLTDYPEVAAKYEVMSTPVTILLDTEGEEVSRSIGFKPPELDELIKELG
ncbi:thioredoxin family protein [Alkalihalobacillus sp. NPDC078783]